MREMSLLSGLLNRLHALSVFDSIPLLLCTAYYYYLLQHNISPSASIGVAGPNLCKTSLCQAHPCFSRMEAVYSNEYLLTRNGLGWITPWTAWNLALFTYFFSLVLKWPRSSNEKLLSQVFFTCTSINYMRVKKISAATGSRCVKEGEGGSPPHHGAKVHSPYVWTRPAQHGPCFGLGHCLARKQPKVPHRKNTSFMILT